MSQLLWRIGADTRTYTADDLSGTGAKITGGRWNEIGVPIAYASESRALACLETIVHLNAGGLPFNRYLVEIEVPDEIWAAALIADASTLPVGWDAEPAGLTSISHGTDWATGLASAILLIPSVIVPEERNALINPAHPDTRKIRARKVRRWHYDPRLDRRPS